ncbi:MAG: hypothetical protein AAGM45_06375, partial [Cyanobacteria bacterium J06588_5]
VNDTVATDENAVAKDDAIVAIAFGIENAVIVEDGVAADFDFVWMAEGDTATKNDTFADFAEEERV